MNEEMEYVLAASVAGAGLLGWLIPNKKDRTKLPVELDNMIATGSETAVKALIQALDAETARAERAEAQVREKEQKISALEERVEALQQLLDDLRAELHAIRDN